MTRSQLFALAALGLWTAAPPRTDLAAAASCPNGVCQAAPPAAATGPAEPAADEATGEWFTFDPAAVAAPPAAGERSIVVRRGPVRRDLPVRFLTGAAGNDGRRRPFFQRGPLRRVVRGAALGGGRVVRGVGRVALAPAKFLHRRAPLRRALGLGRWR